MYEFAGAEVTAVSKELEVTVPPATVLHAVVTHCVLASPMCGAPAWLQSIARLGSKTPAHVWQLAANGMSTKAVEMHNTFNLNTLNDLRADLRSHDGKSVESSRQGTEVHGSLPVNRALI